MVKQGLFDAWIDRIGWTAETFRGFANGIPEEWARDIEATGLGVRVADWPKILRGPRLREHESERTIRVMDVNTADQPTHVKLGAARATRKSKAQRKLYEKGLTVSSLAKKLEEGRPRVSAWFAEGEAQRPVPPRHRKKLADLGITEADGVRFGE